jgi:D-threo-aldose 1-dehydrogenase
MEIYQPQHIDPQLAQELANLPAMPRVTLGRSGIVSTRIGFGTAGWTQHASFEQVVSVMETVFACGIRHVDTAPAYGSEEIIGRALQEVTVPKDMVLATKIGSYVDRELDAHYSNFSATTTYRSVERSLKRLGVSYLNIVHIHDHALRDQPWIFGKHGALEALLDLKSQGVIGSIGMATMALECLLPAVAHGDIDHIQAFHTDTLLNQTARAELFPKARAAHLSVLNNAPYAGYILATGSVPNARYNYGPASPEVIAATRRLEAVCAQKGVALATAAHAYSFQDPLVDVTVIASGNPHHIIGWVKDLVTPLTAADFDEMIKAAGGPF